MSGSDEIRAWVLDVKRFSEESPRRGAEAAAEVVERFLFDDTGGDGAFSNAPWGAATVTVEDWGREEAVVMATGSMGIWAILENGTKGHKIYARGRALSTPYGPRRFVEVKGARAKETWSRGSVAGLVAAEQEIEATFDEVVS